MKSIATLSLISMGLMLNAQSVVKKQNLTVLNIDAKNVGADAVTMGNMVRIELEKLDTFAVMDRYDVQYLVEKNKISVANCYGQTCLTEVGQIIGAEKMFGGTIEQMGKTIMVTYRLIDVKEKRIEKTYVHEFLNLPEEIQNIVKLSIAEMFGRKYDNALMDKLSKKYEFDNSNNNPNQERLRLDGPRMGFVSYTGGLYDRIQEGKNSGGFDAFPAMFQFGYQFEKQYLNEGKVQALFEFVPMITGLDQGYFIPSATLLHGIRSNINGWEFAFGPTFNLMPFAYGYYDESGNWNLNSDWNKSPENAGITNPHETTKRLDSRGVYELRSSFVLAAGRTFRSGKLNIPVNAFVIPGKDGWRFGLSFGFNSKNKPVTSTN
ncbi:MAG: hypothetical protein K0S32_2828 [Bacteroidetes bacterium]|nr:hypothetical protein [Bacteroidota bacterium]